MLSKRGIHTQLVTSAVREIPKHWRGIFRLSIVVSIDGLQPEHDARRTPATYERILKHIQGHTITVHCTITRQQVHRPGYIDEFLRIWSARPEVEKIWISLYTPQIGEVSDERLRPADREMVVNDLHALRLRYPKLALPKGLIDVYAEPPESPDNCVFARTTTVISADLKTRVTPCQYGGLQPVWLHRVGGPRSRRAASALRLHSGRNDLQRLAEGRPAREASASGRTLCRVRYNFSLGTSHDRKP